MTLTQLIKLDLLNHLLDRYLLHTYYTLVNSEDTGRNGKNKGPCPQRTSILSVGEGSESM